MRCLGIYDVYEQFLSSSCSVCALQLMDTRLSGSNCLQCLVEILQQVIDIFNTHTQTDKAWGDTELETSLFRQALHVSKRFCTKSCCCRQRASVQCR